MKNKLLLLLAAASMFSSCKKDKTKPSVPVVLLSKIINNTDGDPDKGKIFAEFSYTGKRLVTASFNYGVNSAVHTFSYNADGNLTGSTINTSHHNGPQVMVDANSSVIQSKGSQINSIDFTWNNNTIENHTYTYDGDKLIKEVSPLTAAGRGHDVVYSYDNNGHNTKQVDNELYNLDAIIYVHYYQTFDGKNSLSSTVPYWVYFTAIIATDALGSVPGLNNPVISDRNGVSINYAYEYNAEGYPSKMSVSGATYIYEYIIVK